MVLLLIIGLVLTGGAVALVARAIALPRIRTAERLEQIGVYGGPPPADEARRSPSEVLDDLATRLGAKLSPTLGGGEERELRALLMSAGMYGTGPGLLLGYRVLSAVGFAAVARDYAVGVVASATEAGTAAAKDWVKTRWLADFAEVIVHQMHWWILGCVAVALALRVWRARQQRGESQLDAHPGRG